MKLILKLLIAFTSLFFGTASFAQEQDTLFDKSSKTFVAIPIISNSPAMKTGFGALAMYFFKLDKKDTISPPSIVSLVVIALKTKY